MSVLVTGGYGLIGSTLTRMLAERGERVSVLDHNVLPGRFSGFAERVKTYRADLGNFAKVLEAVREGQGGH